MSTLVARPRFVDNRGQTTINCRLAANLALGFYVRRKNRGLSPIAVLLPWLRDSWEMRGPMRLSHPPSQPKTSLEASTFSSN